METVWGIENNYKKRWVKLLESCKLFALAKFRNAETPKGILFENFRKLLIPTNGVRHKNKTEGIPENR